MKVLFFAQARQITGCGQYDLEVDKDLSELELWERLEERFPGLAPLQSSARLARGESYLLKGETLHPDDEVAIIPPVSGG